jgi:outer membrane protein assembly factor BamB
MPRSLLLLLVLTPHLLAGDWPQWRGPRRDSVAILPGLPNKLPEKLPARWTQPIGGGYGGISVVGNRLYVMDRRKEPEAERVLCLDVKTGKTVWEYSYPVRYGKLDYGNGPRCTPTVADDKVFTFGAMGHLHALDARNGKLLWSRDTVQEFEAAIPTWGHSCSPLYDGGYVIVQVGARNGCLMSFAARTGKVVWRSLNDPPGYASPVLIGNDIHYFTPTHLVAVDRVEGKERWREPFEGITYGVSISDVVTADGVILASNYWSGSKAIRLKDKKPTVAWEGKQLSLLMSTPLVRGKHVYALDRFRGLKCIEMASGKVLWENEHVTPRDRNPQASLVWVGDSDRALILNTPGELLMVRLTPEKLIPLGKTKVVGKTWAHPAFAAGCIFARNDEEIVCVPLVKE